MKTFLILASGLLKICPGGVIAHATLLAGVGVVAAATAGTSTIKCVF